MSQAATLSDSDLHAWPDRQLSQERAAEPAARPGNGPQIMRPR
jgi:hypothetical protein